jgi:branched-chain amino acid transport system ATP-binding protein
MSKFKPHVHPILIAAVIYLALPFLLPQFGSAATIGTEIAIYTLYALGFNLLLGYTGLVSFGASAFFGMASYGAGLANLYLVQNPLLCILLATIFAAALGLVLGIVILRRRGIYFSLLTLAFTQLFYEITFKWTDLTGGENGLQGVTRPILTSNLSYHFFVAAVVLAGMYAVWRIVHSPFGRVLQATRDNGQRVRCLGYSTKRYQLGAFVLSATIIGLAGSLLTFLIQSVYADNLNWQHAGEPVMMTILGGIHHFLGPLWGSMIFIVLSDQLSSVTEHWWLFFGGLLIAFLLLSPEGVSGIFLRLVGHRGWTLTADTLPPRPKSALPQPEAGTPTIGTILAVRDLNKSFGSLVVAENVHLDVRAGTLHSLIGPNGAGKTTLFNMLTGLVPSDRGAVLFAGRDITSQPAHERVNDGIARSFQIVSVFRDLTVFETVRVAVQARSPFRASLWRDAYKLPGVNDKTWELLDSVGLSERAGETCANLAHGEQRLLEIAVAIAIEPKVLLLDEPLAGLGDAERERIVELIRRLRGRHTILLIEHDIDRVLALSDRITVLHQGRVIAEGAPNEIVKHPAVMEAYLGSGRGTRVAEPATAALPKSEGEALLRLEGIYAGYGKSEILHDLTLEVRPGEVVALLGRNGVGKTTTLRTIAGALRPRSGRSLFNGVNITHLSPDRINRLGIAMVPEGRRIFPNLTVSENLILAMRPGGWAIENVYELFPRLRTHKDARGENLSGGERQMLAIARALMAPQKLILLDEPFEGLAPAVIDEVLLAVERLRQHTSMVLVEHKIDLVLHLAERAYAMVNGQIVFAGASATLHRDAELQQRLLGVGG